MVILQDLVMPNVDGLELVRAYRKNPLLHEIPIVVLSSKEDPIIKKAAFEAGANDYLVKLPDPIELIARIRYHAKACMVRRQLEEALRALQESQKQLLERNVSLESLNEQKNRLLGMAAHDLRTPLGVIQVYSGFLEEEAYEVLDNSQREFIASIRKTSEFMLKLINDLLDVSTIESGQLKLDKDSVDLVEVIRHNVEMNAILANKKGIQLSFDPGPPIPRLYLDESKMEQVLNNLIGNAVKYSHSGTVVRVTVAQEGNHIVVMVQDHGQGIPAEDLPKLFQAFGKANVKTTAGEQSIGLGLVIARKIIEGHSGRIWVESVVGEGSTFRFTLPITKEGLL